MSITVLAGAFKRKEEVERLYELLWKLQSARNLYRESYKKWKEHSGHYVKDEAFIAMWRSSMRRTALEIMDCKCLIGPMSIYPTEVEIEKFPAGNVWYVVSHTSPEFIIRH